MPENMSNAETAAPQQRVIGRPFQPGQSGNPAGRPKGSRHRLAEQFLQDLETTWKKHGLAAMERCATEEPVQFARIMASLLPKQIEVDATLSVFSELTTADEVLALVREELGDETARLLADALDRDETLTIEHDPAHD